MGPYAAICSRSMSLWSNIMSLSNIHDGWWTVFNFSIVFKSIFLIELHCIFSVLIKSYHIIFNIIVFWSGCDRPPGFFFLARFISFNTHVSLLTFFVCFFILFHSCWSHAWAFGFPCKMCGTRVRSSSHPVAILNIIIIIIFIETRLQDTIGKIIKYR